MKDIWTVIPQSASLIYRREDMMVRYVCPRCGNSIQKIFRNLSLGQVPQILPCLSCGGFLETETESDEMSTSSLEEVDYGNTDKAVVWRKDISQRMRERQDKYLKTIEERDRPFGNNFDEKE